MTSVPIGTKLMPQIGDLGEYTIQSLSIIIHILYIRRPFNHKI